MSKLQHSPAQANKQVSAGPPMDLTRAGEFLVLTVSLPGVRAGDFRISLVGNRQVYIEGTVPYRHPLPRESLVLAERAYGPFSRTLQLPLPVDAQAAGVSFERGVLTARLPLQCQRVALDWDRTEGWGGA